eukprot:TRINITY_DN64766_c6_g5_i1.p1 TRINITY_DN64766_c6_g5~~TRINITY_DN64766_c6_g5_i1.p1  ORF type:complete len:435 (+),score=9.11 TRINITY_DN64766_c6_g5_i1:93-1307(+)
MENYGSVESSFSNSMKSKDGKSRSHVFSANPTLDNVSIERTTSHKASKECNISSRLTGIHTASISTSTEVQLGAETKKQINKNNKDKEEDKEDNKEEDLEKKDDTVTPLPAKARTTSLVGTLAYMAPEVTIMCAKRNGSKGSYTDAVDWWALGCTLYKLLTGFEPFRILRYERIASKLPTLLTQMSYEEAFTYLFGEINIDNFQHVINDTSRDVITKLLTFDPEKRLGSDIGNKKGQDMLKSHPFFTDINWELIEEKKMEPPFIPDIVIPDKKLYTAENYINNNNDDDDDKKEGEEKYYTFPEMLLKCGKIGWLPAADREASMSNKDSKSKLCLSTSEKSQHNNKPVRTSKYVINEAQQLYFTDWNYVSPFAIEEETKNMRNNDDKKSTKSIITWFQTPSMKIK